MNDHVLCVLEGIYIAAVAMVAINFGNVLMVLHSLFFVLIAVYVKWFASSVNVGSSQIL